MQVRATAKYIRMSPRKVRLVLQAIRGQRVEEALARLRFMPQAAARPVAKVLRSAAASAENNYNLSPADLYVAQAVANPGPSLKRFRALARGRAGLILKRSAHITVVVEEK